MRWVNQDVTSELGKLTVSTAQQETPGKLWANKLNTKAECIRTAKQRQARQTPGGPSQEANEAKAKPPGPVSKVS